MRKVLYVSTEGTEREEEKIIKELQDKGYAVINYAGECLFENFRQVLEDDFFYFVFSFEFYTMLSKACVATGTKYVAWICREDKESLNVGSAVNYFLISDSLLYERIKGLEGRVFYVSKEDNVGAVIEKSVFNDAELLIYQLIEQSSDLRGKYKSSEILFKSLESIENQQELLEATAIFFDRMEEEKLLRFALKKQVIAYINLLLQKKSLEAWRELMLWNNRHGVRELKNTFWEFYILWIVMSIYVEETKEYIERGVVPCVLQFESLEEITNTYFETLFLLRRLEYDIAPENEAEVISYIVEKNLSGIFIIHIINRGKIANKAKVGVRVKELLAKYEQ